MNFLFQLCEFLGEPAVNFHGCTFSETNSEFTTAKSMVAT